MRPSVPEGSPACPPLPGNRAAHAEPAWEQRRRKRLLPRAARRAGMRPLGAGSYIESSLRTREPSSESSNPIQSQRLLQTLPFLRTQLTGRAVDIRVVLGQRFLQDPLDVGFGR